MKKLLRMVKKYYIDGLCMIAWVLLIMYGSTRIFEDYTITYTIEGGAAQYISSGSWDIMSTAIVSGMIILIGLIYMNQLSSRQEL